MTNEVLLNLPHRQFVFTLPKALRPYFRHDRRLFADVSRLIYSIISEFYDEAAGRPLNTALIVAHQTFGDILRWNPHFHTIVLEGGFDSEGTFFYLPFWGLENMTELFRRCIFKLFLEKKLINESFARNMLSWKHSGFSIDNSVQILDGKSRISLAEYISRPPISLKKINYEPFKGRVLFHTHYNEYFKENLHMFEAADFLAELTQHIPPKGVQLIRRYGLYSSRIKGNWEKYTEVAERAPPGWKKQHGMTVQVCDAENPDTIPTDTDSVEVSAYKKAWARLLSRVYEIDPFICPRCGSEMKVLAIILKPQEIKRILHHLVKQGRPPPGIDLDVF